ncbi:MAG TPA: hypothetical protein VEB66_18275 [Opitutaceae bacterium]|nr:hypothetical protein [Opitutaceae bacterium]
MKGLAQAGLILVAALLVVGCGSVSKHWRERIDSSPVRSQDFAGEYRAVYRAAQEAMKRIEFVVSRASLDDGVVAGHSRIQPGDPTRSARQWQLSVQLEEKPSGLVSAGLVLSEQVEGGVGGAQEKRVREHSLYETYLTAVQQVLNENLAIAPAGRN